MAKPVATLLIDIRSDVGKLQKDLDKTRRQLHVSMAKLNKSATIAIKVEQVKQAIGVFDKVGKALANAFKTLTDAAATEQFNANMQAIEDAWQRFLVSVGESITRSEAFNEALKILAEWLGAATAGADGLGTVIGDTLAKALVLARAPLAAVNGLLATLHGALGAVAAVLGKTWGALATVTIGPVSTAFREVADTLNTVSSVAFENASEKAQDTLDDYNAVGAGIDRVNAKIGAAPSASPAAAKGAKDKAGAARGAGGGMAPLMRLDTIDVPVSARAAPATGEAEAAKIAAMEPAMDGLLANLGKIREEAERVMQTFVDLAESTATVLADAVVSPLEKGFMDFEAMLQGLKGIVLDVIKQLLIAVALKLILAPEAYAASGVAGGIGGVLADAIGFSSGGRVPGAGSGDTVPAWLTPGEYVIPADTVRKYGSSFFANLDSAPRFADGGLVAAGPASRGGSGGSTVYVSAIDPKTTREVVASRIEAAQIGRIYDRQGDLHRRQLQRAAMRPRSS